MSPKFSLQNVLDLRHGKVELLEIELGKLHAIHQETQNLHISLEQYQNSLLNELPAFKILFVRKITYCQI